MKISERLPQFEKQAALLIVVGRQDGVFYQASKGTIERIQAFKIPNKHYSDREGEFKSRGQGLTLSSGAPKELRRQEIIRDFLREFKARIKIVPAFSSLYLFAPADTKAAVLKTIPAEWRKKLLFAFDGNFFNRHPLKLVEKIAAISVQEIEPNKPEAKKIFDAAKKARSASLKNKAK